MSEGALCTAAAAAAANSTAATSDAAAAASAAEAAPGNLSTPGLPQIAASALPSNQQQRRSDGAAPVAVTATVRDAAAKALPPAVLLYADGCTLAVSGAAQPLLLSGSMCNPPQRPLGRTQ